MGFISFSLKYYEAKLQQLEFSAASNETIYLAKQLLKILNDLADEGYPELNEKLEETYQGVSRLKKYLNENNAEPFPIHQKTITDADVSYGRKDFELAEAIRELVSSAEKSTKSSDDAFLTKLIRFCKWIGYEENTAYIFLLRDTLLPYIYYQSKNRKNLYPWLLSRKTLAMLSGNQNADNEIRASLIKALEIGNCHNYKDYCGIVLPDIRTTLKKHPETETHLTEMLEKIKEPRIVVVESGCSGTFPMLLKSLDDRVEMRMYTTYPYLFNIYEDRVYTTGYEENRLFETLYSQNLYFRFSDLKDGHFFVKKCQNEYIKEKSLAEIKTILKQ